MVRMLDDDISNIEILLLLVRNDDRFLKVVIGKFNPVRWDEILELGDDMEDGIKPLSFLPLFKRFLIA